MTIQLLLSLIYTPDTINHTKPCVLYDTFKIEIDYTVEIYIDCNCFNFAEISLTTNIAKLKPPRTFANLQYILLSVFICDSVIKYSLSTCFLTFITVVFCITFNAIAARF